MFRIYKLLQIADWDIIVAQLPYANQPFGNQISYGH